jgi:hypothetical protein
MTYVENKNTLVEMLKNKDEHDDSLDGQFRMYDWVKTHKSQFYLQVEEQKRYEKILMGKCVKPCFTALGSSVVTTEESECMTNCMTKGMEALMLQRHLNLGNELKQFGAHYFRQK